MNSIIKKMQYKHEVKCFERYLKHEIKHFHMTQEDAVRYMLSTKGELKEKYFGDRYAIV